MHFYFSPCGMPTSIELQQSLFVSSLKTLNRVLIVQMMLSFNSGYRVGLHFEN